MSDLVAPAETKTPLTPANQNPWYVLMTLYGEQEEEFDRELHEKNRQAWNAWAGQSMNDDERTVAAKSTGVTVEELSAWPRLRDEIGARHRRAWYERYPTGADWTGMPPPNVPINCRGLLFARDFLVTGFVFPSDSDFSGTTFRRQADFGSALFCSVISLNLASFEGEAWFANATFNDFAMFNSAKFSRVALFDYAKFNKSVASFSFAEFSGGASFTSTTFNVLALFSSVAFNAGEVSLTDPLSGSVTFSSATFRGAAMFAGTTFNAPTYFVKARFGANTIDVEANFSDCHFAKPTSFRATRFLSQYPIFEGAVLHPETAFTANAKDEEGRFWPDCPADPLAAKESCAKIRNNVGKQGSPDDEHFFYRKEMRFAGMAATNPVEKTVNWFFRVFSRYGSSIVRPVVGLATVFALGLVAYWGFFLQGTVETPLGTALGLSFSNLFPYFGFTRFFDPKFAVELPPVLKALGGFQTVSGAVLLFLFALGLRTRFRMR